VNADAQTIGRANLDGTGINQSFIATDLAPIDVAVDGQHIYWSNSYENTIGRANVDGSGVNQSFITNSAGIVGQPEGVAVDGAHIYWANNQSSQAGESQTIGRANLDGSDVNQNFITGANTPAGVAVGPADIFWSNTAPLVGSIGHASINGGDVYIKSNYQNFQRYTEVDLSIAADAEATLPALIEACKRLITDDRKRAFQARGVKLAEASRQALEDTRVTASYGWDASPITTARVSAELGAQIKNEDWSLVSEALFFSNWPLRLWDVNKHHQYIGGKGGAGIGYGAPAALGAALANKKHGRLTVSIQTDGDLCYAPGILWTAAHHRIPLLSIMHNNRAYHQEVMGVQSLAARRERGIDRAHIGTTIDDPNIDFAKLAQGFGIHAEGPISEPQDLGPAIARAIAVVKRGEPALVDVVTQPR